MSDHRLIMLGLAGSKAYGLDTPESDEDWLRSAKYRRRHPEQTRSRATND